MNNSTHFPFFILTAYSDPGPFKYLYFFILLCLYVTIIAVNALLIAVICLNRALHEPMYILVCTMFVNELWGSLSVLPCLMDQVLRDVHTLSFYMCFLQIFVVYSYVNVEFLILAVMSYDRYLAICFPLQYRTKMSTKKMAWLVALAWLFPFVEVSFMISLSAPLPLCGNLIPKVYCDNYAVVKLACSDTSLNNIYGLIYTCVFLLSVPAVILYSYARIFRVCFSGSKQTRQKAVRTCAPHMASLMNLAVGSFFEVVQSRFDMSSVPNGVRVFLSLYFLTCTPLFNLMMYGLNLHKVRLCCKNLLLSLNK